MEIVAPSQSLECTRAALKAGADAVYCSGKLFHARESLDVGSTINELREVRDLCSEQGKYYYLVFNAFPSELDWQECIDELTNLLTTSPDAIIISSLGLLRWVKKHYYNLPIIISVLAGSWDNETIRVMEELGASAVTVSRGAQIRMSKKQNGIPLKLIAHGNSCSLLDGTCRLGSFLDGARGRFTRQCKPHLYNGIPSTNPCRGEYYNSIDGEKVSFQHFPIQYSALSLIPKWITSGIKSLKINGRTNSPAWIEEVVAVYREAVDSFLETQSGWEVRSQWIEKLRSLVSTERLDIMPDPIWKITSNEYC